MAYRPMVHDGNKDNMRLRGWQPPEVHQSDEEKERRMAEWAQEVHQFDWVYVIRNVEGVNIDLNEFGTPEHAVPDMLRDLYGSAKEAAKDVTERAGGVIRSACDIDCVFRDPELLKYAGERAAELEDALRTIIDWCGSKEYVHTTILENAAPYLFAFIYYPGMPPHNNGTEWIIRSWVTWSEGQTARSQLDRRQELLHTADVCGHLQKKRALRARLHSCNGGESGLGHLHGLRPAVSLREAQGSGVERRVE